MSRRLRLAVHVAAYLLGNRRRAGLMMLGLAVGIATLTTVIALGEGTRARVMDLVTKHGLDMLMVRAGGAVQVFAPIADRAISSLSQEDARAIETAISGIRQVSPVQNKRGIEVVYRDRTVITRVFGVAPTWADIRRWRVVDGDFISDRDMSEMARVAVLGATVARRLFPEGEAVGQSIRLSGDLYTVKGLFGPMGASAGGDDWDDRIVIPFTTSSRRLLGRPYLEQIVIQVRDARRLVEVAEQVRSLLRERHRIDPGQEDDFFVREPEDVQSSALETSSTLTALLLAIALIALVTGGIVIMNVMLLSVSQRTHEIGLRRALGARAADIRTQFLLEAIAVALAGALAGVLGGLLIASALEAAGLAVSRITWVPLAAALVSCLAVALLFGTYPARRAARIDPAAALRDRKL